MEREKLATASASGILAIISAIWYVVTGMLFLGFGDTFTKQLAPLMSSGGLGYLAGALSFIFAGIMIIGGIFVYEFKYRLGGVFILIGAFVGVIAGGGFYVATLWGAGSGFIAFICPNLEERILQSKKES